MFRDRAEAGRRLADALAGRADEDVVVVGLPRGGVPVAFEVARVLHAPLDVLVVRKIGHPAQPELGIGAVGEDATIVLNESLLNDTGVTDTVVSRLAERQVREVERRVQRYRGDHPRVPLAGRTVIIVDDGLATGFTARAAVQIARHAGAGRVVLAVPVAPMTTVADLRALADDVVCLQMPESFVAVGQWYADFDQVSDRDVTQLLDLARSAPSTSAPSTPSVSAEVEVVAGGVPLPGDLTVPPSAIGFVVFAHGSGSSRHSPRNRAVASALNGRGLATLLLDLLTEYEERDRDARFDIPLLAARLVDAAAWVRTAPGCTGLPLGFFGPSTGAAAALIAAADLAPPVAAVVSRGGRPDLAGHRLAAVEAPTLLIVGGADPDVLELNRRAQQELRCENRLEIVPGATHLFEEPGALDAVARLAGAWFEDHFSDTMAAAR